MARVINLAIEQRFADIVQTALSERAKFFDAALRDPRNNVREGSDLHRAWEANAGYLRGLAKQIKELK